MTFEVLMPIKAKTPEGIRDIEPGEIVTLPEPVALRLLEGGKIKPYAPECFSLDGTLESIFSQARCEKWTDDRLLETIDSAICSGDFTAPWGFKVKDSPLIGTYWIISDTTARERISADLISFTLDELRPIVETSKVFMGSKVVKVIRHKGKKAVNA